jgi:hypothetical protein
VPPPFADACGHPGNNVLLSVVLFLAPLATCLAPRLTPFFFGIVSLTLIGAALRRKTPWWNLIPRKPALVACLIVIAYLFINATWSLDRVEAFAKAALFAALLLMTFAAVSAAATVERKHLRQAGLAFAVGLLFGAIFVAVELLTEGFLTRTAMNWIPLLHPTSLKRLKMSHGQVTAVRLAELNQNVNLVLFCLWPGLLALMGLEGILRSSAFAALFVAVAAVVAISEHESSQVALLGSSLAVLLGWKWRRFATPALAVVWCAAFIFVIPLSRAAYQSELHLVTSLPNSARARIILWEYMGTRALTRPVAGFGIESAPVLSKQEAARGGFEQPDNFVYPRKIGHHGHNIFLQTWFELGGLGALLFGIAGIALVSLIRLLPNVAQPFAVGTFVAFFLVGAFAWGMWQSWFMSAVALLPIYVRICAAAVDE